MLFITIVSLNDPAKAQGTDVNIREYGLPDSLHSSILDQERQFKVILPPGYKPGSAEKYDVMYVLDGSDWNTGTIAQIQHFVEDQGFMPPTIIVSIIEPDRNADLAPTHLDTWKNSGGADKFLGFLKNELIPYINKQYPSNGDNTLWGHSLSGMFVLYALVTEPTLFKSFIAIDPSAWWDNNYVLKMAAAKLSTLPFQNTTLFIAGRETTLSSMKIDTLETILKNNAPASLKWKLDVYSGETHGSVKFKGTYDGLKFLYDGYIKIMYFDPMHGIVLKDKPFKLFYHEDTAHLHYTIDGSVPTINSAKVQAEITVNGPVKVTYKALTNRSKYNRTATGLFTDEVMPKPLPIAPKNWQSGGFNYAYYEGTWDKWPDLTKLKSTKTGITDNDFDIDKLPRKNHYALVIDGLLESREVGYYIFTLGSGEKGTKLYIDNKLVIAFTGDGDDFGQTCIVPLSKGFYPFRIEYLHQKEDGNNLDWQQILTPSIMESQNTILIPVNLEYNKK
ncbi:alpha/beta hydrolase-fold protein [Mucilaginibacter angelicae]|uniref:Alpha/beta hydrolase-fold protein n=1 Tax=Mucilaginibacter angelicae TaxID=869718 RepID=A0ABV6LF47_9SPHI